jgi:hypothetical protein
MTLATVRPGNSTTVSFGLRYEKNPRMVPQLQVNLLHKSPQLPVYSNLYGYQVFPRYTASAGATYAF